MNVEPVSVAELWGRVLTPTGTSRGSKVGEVVGSRELVGIEFDEVGEETKWEIHAGIKRGAQQLALPILRVIKKTPVSPGGEGDEEESLRRGDVIEIVKEGDCDWCQVRRKPRTEKLCARHLCNALVPLTEEKASPPGGAG